MESSDWGWNRALLEAWVAGEEAGGGSVGGRRLCLLSELGQVERSGVLGLHVGCRGAFA